MLSSFEQINKENNRQREILNKIGLRISKAKKAYNFSQDKPQVKIANDLFKTS